MANLLLSKILNKYVLSLRCALLQSDRDGYCGGSVNGGGGGGGQGKSKQKHNWDQKSWADKPPPPPPPPW